MTFGDFRAEFKNRRLVAGADTYVRLFPLSHDTVVCRRMVDCHTAVANPRTEQLYRKAYALDPASSASGEPVYRPTEFTGQPRGDQAVLIPFDAYGGQTGMIDARIHDYPRYVYTQIREVVPLTARSVLYELDVQGDTRPEAGVPPGKSRKNYIAVTPWAPEVERVKVRVVPPDPSRLPEHLKTAEWEQWIKSLPEDKKAEKEIEVVRQGVYYETQKGEVQQQLANKYGITRGFVNGALLIQTPYE
ncbi:MAG: hypothetical protein D6800_06740 [Candidatus Zixiibacteriota bacterium]|nr:MAG: hypothetical protein D6800_06740 [candidate division Zixibacteria bacterium]